jgi:Tol biopolymer transport system component
MRATKGVRQLTFERDPAVSIGVPTWSPAGDWIGFVLARDWRSSIWLIRPDGSGLHELVASGWGPCWTPDGRQLIYTTGQDSRAAHLERIGLDGGAPVVVRTDASTPALAPDGRILGHWLAVPHVDGATSNLWALPTSGGPMKQLTDFGNRCNVMARSVSWAADSQLLFAAVAETETDIVLFDGLIK